MRLLFCLTFSIFTFSANAQSLTPTQTRQDLAFLKTKLENIYPGLGYYYPKKQFDKLYDSLYNNTGNLMQYDEFFRYINPLVSNQKDGHLSLDHRKNYYGKKPLIFPIQIRSVDQKYYVFLNGSTDTTLVAGTEILKVNGRNIADIHETLANVIRNGSDGSNRTGRYLRSLSGFSGYYAEWFGTPDSASIEFKHPKTNQIQTRTIACRNKAEINSDIAKRYPKLIDTSPNLTLKIIDSLKNTAVLRISTFQSFKGFDILNLKFNRKLKKVFTEIENKRIENLVIDLTGNGGGAVSNSGKLLEYLMPQPFNQMDSSRLTAKGKWAYFIIPFNILEHIDFWVNYRRDPKTGDFVSRNRQKKDHQPIDGLRFRGNLYFLQNGASYSASSTVLSQALSQGVGTLVGEACGGAYWGDFAGRFRNLKLPNSKIQVRVPIKTFYHGVDPKKANGFTVEPDFKVQRTYQNIINPTNFYLDYALKLIKDGKKAH